VVAIGVLATMLLAKYLMRPIRALTRTALEISRGELPPELPDVTATDEIMQMVAALRAMLERINEVSQQELLRASRQAGMAEVATGILHNVGNVLTAVNVTVEMLRERTQALPLARVRRLHELLAAALDGGAVDAAKISAAVQFVEVVADSLARGRDDSMKQIETLAGHVDHIKRVVSMQNAYARLRSAAEPTRITDVIEEAREIGCPPERRQGLAFDIEIADDIATSSVLVDRHRVLQILVNLISNARDAVHAHDGAKRISIAAERAGDWLRLRVTDTGVGIAPELAQRIFGAGVTTKANGHGYGLHSSALSARQMGGSLECASNGAGHGATFTLSIPIESLEAKP
jgi:signal transduction histidine kinase